MEFPTIDKFAKDVAEKALDEFIYEGKTIREWVELLAKQQPCEDCISREAVKDMLDARGIKAVMTFDRFKELLDKLPSVTPQPKIGRCKDCKWWKDSDGKFRRGIGAESRCPINRKEVYEGNGYCFLYEAKMEEKDERI